MFWIDPDLGHVVLRYVELVPLENDGRGVGSQIDITYARDEIYGWIPSEWESTMLAAGSGELVMSISVRVVHSEFNAAIP